MVRHYRRKQKELVKSRISRHRVIDKCYDGTGKYLFTIEHHGEKIKQNLIVRR